MSNDLIPIFTRPIGDSINAVDARELHRVLGIGKDFSTWIKARLVELHLDEGSDYEKLNDLASPNLGSANRIDYALTIDAAKHIAMAERNPIGTKVRTYFIKCEKQLRAPVRALDWRAKREERLAAQAETSRRKMVVNGYERFIELSGDLMTADIRQVVASKIVEAVTGESAVMLLPADAKVGWKRPEEIANDLDSTTYLVGQAIKALGLKGPEKKGLAGLSEPRMNVARDTHRPVEGFVYSPEAVAMIAKHLARTTSPGGDA